MASGMGVDENCVNDFSQMKIRKTCTWIVFQIDKDKIVVEKTGSGDISKFLSALPKDDCRYGVFDSIATKKIHFILWAPDSANVKSRMTYASSKDALMKKLDGVAGVALECHEEDDLKHL